MDDKTTTPDQPTSSADVEVRRVFLGTGLFWAMILGVLLTVAVIILAAQNTQEITIEFLSWQIATPFIVMVLAVLLIGILLAEIVGLVFRHRRRRRLTDREELKRLRAAE